MNRVTKYNLVWCSGIVTFVMIFIWLVLGPPWLLLSVPSMMWTGIADLWTDKLLDEKDENGISLFVEFITGGSEK